MESKQTSQWKYDKRLVPGLIELVTQGLTLEMVDDAEAVLSALHILRPDMRSFDIFNAWVMIKRGQYADASRVLRAFDASPEMGPMATALLAVCNFANGDSEWQANVNEVIERNENPDAVALVNTLMGKVNGTNAGAGNEGSAASGDQVTQPKMDWADSSYSQYLRA